MKVGDRVNDKYELLEKIGDGGFGDVFKVVDLTTGKLLALKYCTDSREAPVGRFRREVTILSKLNHENVIALEDMGLEHNPPFFVMPLATGNIGELIPKLNGNTLEILKVFKDICVGVKVIHEAGFFHRDIKPSNVLYFDDTQIVIADLGFGRQIERESEIHDSSKYGNGTPAYIAPEQKDALENADYRTDVYQLGKTLQTLLTGTPFGLDKSKVTPGLLFIIQKATEFNPDKRYQRVSDLIEAVDNYIKTLDPNGNPVLAVHDAIATLKEGRNLNPVNYVSLLDGLNHIKGNSVEFIESFDKVPLLILRNLAEHLDSEMEHLIDSYEQQLTEYKRIKKPDYDYADEIAGRMEAIYSNSTNMTLKIQCLRIILRTAISYNRYAVMDTFDKILRAIKTDDEAAIVAQLLREEKDCYSRIFERIKPEELRFPIRVVRQEIEQELEEARQKVQSTEDSSYEW